MKNKLLPFSFFLLFFAAVAAYGPYMVIYYQDLGFSGPQIGLLSGISPLITLVTVPFWTGIADKTGLHRQIMGGSLLCVVASLLAFPFLSVFPAVLAAVMISNIFLAPVVSFANSATVFMLGEEKDIYGRVRLGGTIGFGLSALAAGFLVESFDLSFAFWIGAALLLLGFLVSLQLEFDEESTEQPAGVRTPTQLIRSPLWIIFLFIGFLGGIAFAITNNYFFPYMSELGARESAMGIALAISTLSEVPVMLLANRFTRRFQAYGTLLIGLFFTALRMVLFGLTSEPAVAMAIQLLNGLSLPLLLVAAVAYADDHAPRGLRTTAQGLFNTALMGVGAAVGGFLGGLLLVNRGGQSLFLISGLGIFGGLALVLLLGRRSQKPGSIEP